jgi:hypothetical protein
MNTHTHPISPEEIMAFIDDELSVAETQVVAAHVESCTECSHLAAEFRSTSEMLLGWETAAVPATVQESVMPIAFGAIFHRAGVRRNAKPPKWFAWAMGFAGLVAMLFVVSKLTTPYRRQRLMAYSNSGPTGAATVRPNTVDATKANAIKMLDRSLADASSSYPDEYRGMLASSQSAVNTGMPQPQMAPSLETTPSPMIARTISVAVRVKDISAARSSLDVLLTSHHSYFAQMNVNSPAGSSRTFQASLRVPASELSSMLEQLRALGVVENESQSGEEVTRQHEDLIARLKNYRETEERLRGILAQRTGKITDVLQVEEEISRVRGEIERMDAERATLEHRVSYASVDLQLMEQFTEPVNPPADSSLTLMRNAVVAGYHHLTGALLGIVLFLLEYGPPILLWLVILASPIVWIWRRYRKSRNSSGAA